jgi:hypothetical protein
MDMKASKTINGDIVCDGNRGGRQLVAPSKHQCYRETKMQRNTCEAGANGDRQLERLPKINDQQGGISAWASCQTYKTTKWQSSVD